jgi:hypothetical protein
MPRLPYPRHSSVVRALLATCVLYFVLNLSAGDRGVVDWIVISLVGAAIAWNILQLSRLMHARGGGRALWHVERTTLFWVIGLMNTVWIRAGDVGTWKNYLGWAILTVAVVDTVVLFRNERAAIRERAVERPTE